HGAWISLFAGSQWKRVGNNGARATRYRTGRDSSAACWGESNKSIKTTVAWGWSSSINNGRGSVFEGKVAVAPKLQMGFESTHGWYWWMSTSRSRKWYAIQ